MAQDVQEQIGPLPAIGSKPHLLEVGRRMLGADCVSRSHDTTHGRGAVGFGALPVGVSPNKRAAPVRDGPCDS